MTTKLNPHLLTFAEGYEAFRKGRPKDDAPKESPRRESWLKGWEQAAKDADR